MPNRLVSGSSPVNGKVEVHEMSMQNGVMTMRPVQGGLEIKPGQIVVLKPESLHLMLIGLEQSLVKGERRQSNSPRPARRPIDLRQVRASSLQFGRTSAPIIPHLVHTALRSRSRSTVSSGQRSASMIAL
jgi:hypothetical protein